jgi:LysR family transcriptional regulator, carnitine catabolism transcriptional activator
MNITSRQLKAFLLTAQHQSFSRAAEQLFITQSGMSVLVRGLEEQLGFRLFDRTTRRVTLTPSGLRFLPIADQSLGALESAVVSISHSASDSGHDLRVGATPLVAAELLPVAIAQYAKLQPKVRIRLFDVHRPRLIEMVQAGEIDAGLTVCPHPAPELTKVALVRFSLMLIAAANAPYRLGPRVRWADIAARKLIGSPPEAPVQELIDSYLRRVGRLTPPEIVCNYIETQVAMVEAGAGIAVIPTLALPACIKRGVTMHSLVDPVAPGVLYWTENRGRKPPAAAEGFSTFLKEYLSGILESWPPASVKAA